MTSTWVRRHANGVNAFAVHVGGAWSATVGSGEFNVVCASLEEAEAVADERVATTFSHDCLAAGCPPWGHTEPPAH